MQQMQQMQKFLLALLILPLIDAPWLFYQFKTSLGMFSTIQGGAPIKTRLWPAVVVYIALAYLLLKQRSALEAGLSGAAVYAVYDFTNLTIFKDYTMQFALMDTAWGGILFAAAYSILEMLT